MWELPTYINYVAQRTILNHNKKKVNGSWDDSSTVNNYNGGAGSFKDDFGLCHGIDIIAFSNDKKER